MPRYRANSAGAGLHRALVRDISMDVLLPMSRIDHAGHDEQADLRLVVTANRSHQLELRRRQRLDGEEHLKERALQHRLLEAEEALIVRRLGVLHLLLDE